MGKLKVETEKPTDTENDYDTATIRQNNDASHRDVEPSMALQGELSKLSKSIDDPEYHPGPLRPASVLFEYHQHSSSMSTTMSAVSSATEEPHAPAMRQSMDQWQKDIPSPASAPPVNQHSSSSSSSTTSSTPASSSINRRQRSKKDYVQEYGSPVVQPAPPSSSNVLFLQLDGARRSMSGNSSSSPLLFDKEEYLTCIENTDIALLSVLSDIFVKRVARLSGGFPMFSGKQIINILVDILTDANFSDHHCMYVANTLMHSKPYPLYQAVDVSGDMDTQGYIMYKRRTDTASSKESSFDPSSDIYYTLCPQVKENQESLPVGVFTNFTRCYTPHCKVGIGCYAPRCPNKPSIILKEVTLPQKKYRLAEEPFVQRRQTVYKYDPSGDNTDKEKDKMLKLQAIMYLHDTEGQYLQNLKTLHEFIVMPLSTLDIIEQDRRQLYVDDIFNNYYELYTCSNKFYAKLTERLQQKINSSRIDDIFHKHLLELEDLLKEYIPNIPLAEYNIKAEKRRNERFAQFLEQVNDDDKDEEEVQQQQKNKMIFTTTRNNNINDVVYVYLKQPRHRLQCYADCLDSIIIRTHPSSPDYDHLTACRTIVERIQTDTELMTSDVKQRVAVLKLGDKLTCAPGEFYDLQLNDPKRRIYYRGELKYQPWKPDSKIFIAKRARRRKVHIFILDHVLLITELVENVNYTYTYSYCIKARPIPLQMLGVFTHESSSTLSDSNFSTSSSNANNNNNNNGGGRGFFSTFSSYNPFHHYHHLHTSSKQKFTLVHKGRIDLDKQRYQHTLAIGSPQELQKCLGALEEAKLQRKQSFPGVFRLSTLDETSFRINSDNWDDVDKVNCTVPLDGGGEQQRIIIGTDTGVYIKTVGEMYVQRILQLKKVTQVAVMRKCHMLIVLADEVLFGYPQEMLPSSSSVIEEEAFGQFKEFIDDNIQFFRIGKSYQKDLLVYARNTHSVRGSRRLFALEPVESMCDPQSKERISRIKPGMFGVTNASREKFFQIYRELAINTPAADICFTLTHIIIVCKDHFMLVEPQKPKQTRQIVPDWEEEDPRLKAYLTEEKYTNLKALKLYCIHNRVLLCYNRFAFFVDYKHMRTQRQEHGDSPLLFEWECVPEKVAYHHPYIIGFAKDFIEIHHVDTGSLEQIITGKLCRLTYEGFDDDDDKPVVHGCIFQTRDTPKTQHIFQLEVQQ